MIKRKGSRRGGPKQEGKQAVSLPFAVQAAIIAASIGLVYLPTIELGWIWDDDQYIYNNPLLRDVSGLWAIWFEPDKTPQYYPIVFTMLWGQYQLFGISPVGYHVVNVLLHALNSILLLGILRRIPLSQNVALPVALAWGLHPVQVETVAWCTELKNLLSAAFYGIAWLCFWPLFDTGSPQAEVASEDGSAARQRSRATRYGAGTLCFIFALLSKSVTATMPAALCLVLWYKHGQIPWKALKALSPLLVIGGLLGWNTARLERLHVGAFGSEWDYGLLDRIGIAARALLHYAWNSLLPLEQIFFYPRYEVGWQAVRNLLAVAAVVAIAGAAIWLVRKGHRGVFACLGIFVGSAFPALGFLNVYPHRFAFVADHFVYIASAGLICLIWSSYLWLATRILQRWFDEKYLWIPVVIVLGLYGVGVNRHLPVFSSQITLWEDTLAKNPACPAAMQNLGLEYLANDRLLDAERILTAALEYDFDQFQTINSLGLVYERQGRNSEALESFLKAAKLNPLPVRPYVNAANLLRSEAEFLEMPDRRDKVVEYYTQAWEVKENYLAAFGLGTVNYEAGAFGDAADWFAKAGRLVPTDLDARYNEVQSLLDAGRLVEAREAAARLIADFPDDRASQSLAARLAE